MTRNGTIMAMILSTIAIAILLSMMSKAKSVPPIHDISTDLINPADFMAIAPLHTDAQNPVTYDGIKTAKQQRTAYPELRTFNSPQSKYERVTAVEKAIHNLGWELVNTDARKDMVEATDTTA